MRVAPSKPKLMPVSVTLMGTPSMVRPDVGPDAGATANTRGVAYEYAPEVSALVFWPDTDTSTDRLAPWPAGSVHSSSVWLAPVLPDVSAHPRPPTNTSGMLLGVGALVPNTPKLVPVMVTFTPPTVLASCGTTVDTVGALNRSSVAAGDTPADGPAVGTSMLVCPPTRYTSGMPQPCHGGSITSTTVSVCTNGTAVCTPLTDTSAAATLPSDASPKLRPSRRTRVPSVGTPFTGCPSARSGCVYDHCSSLGSTTSSTTGAP